MKYISFERFKKEILKSELSPERTAASMAAGVWLAFSPFPGLHLLTAFLVARFMRLNGVVLLAGVLIHNPWSMILIHMTGLVVGDLLLTGSIASLEQFELFPWGELGFTTIFSAGFWSVNAPLLKTFIKPFFVGSLLVASTGSALSYRITLRFLKRVKGDNQP